MGSQSPGRLLLSTIQDPSADAVHSFSLNANQKQAERSAQLPQAKVDLLCSGSLLKPTGLGKHRKDPTALFSVFYSGAHRTAYIYLSILSRCSEVADCQETL